MIIALFSGQAALLVVREFLLKLDLKESLLVFEAEAGCQVSYNLSIYFAVIIVSICSLFKSLSLRPYRRN